MAKKVQAMPRNRPSKDVRNAADRARRARAAERKEKRREANRRYYLKNKPALLLVAEHGGRVAAARLAASDLWGL